MSGKVTAWKPSSELMLIFGLIAAAFAVTGLFFPKSFVWLAIGTGVGGLLVAGLLHLAWSEKAPVGPEFTPASEVGTLKSGEAATSAPEVRLPRQIFGRWR